MKWKEKGFTLVELIVVTAILAMLIVVSIGILNPIQQVNKGNDARRKKDLNLIKTAFEEYNNDKGCYINQSWVSRLMDATNCNSNVFSPWLNRWPCDPVTNEPYIILLDNNESCPKWFKVVTQLELKKDVDIPKDWYENVYYFGNQREYSSLQFNYGVSSPNVKWNDMDTRPSNIICSGTCSVMRTKPDANGSTGCNMSGERCDKSPEYHCYSDIFCRPGCETQSCVR